MKQEFDSFPEIPGIDEESKNKTENRSENLTICSEDLKKLIKQMKKQRKAQKKMQKRIHKISKQLSLDDEFYESRKGGSKDSKKKNSTNATPKKEKSFLGKLGDTILKALPGILSTAATVVATIILGQAPNPLRKFRGAVA